MDDLQLGARVRVTTEIPAFHFRRGRITQIEKPYILGEKMKEQALMEMRLFTVQFDDGGSFRFRGRDLQPLIVTGGRRRVTQPA